MASVSPLECIICFHRYDTLTRRPAVLPCGHTFCEACVKAVRSSPSSRCSEDLKPFQTYTINFALATLASNPAQAICALQADIISQVKERSSSLSIEQQVAAYAEGILSLPFSEDGAPQYVNWRHFEVEIDFLKGVVDAHPRLSLRANYLLAILYWATCMRNKERVGGLYCKPSLPRDLFQKIADSPDAPPKDRAFSRFGYCYLELNRFEKVAQFLGVIEDDPQALPIHRSTGRFYRALFHLKGLGGLPQSYSQAKDLLAGLIEGDALPGQLKSVAILLLAELYILGLGGLAQDPQRALDLLLGDGHSQAPNRRFQAKRLYWVAVLYNGKLGLPPNEVEAERYFTDACAQDGVNRPSRSEMQRSLESLFKVGNLHFPQRPDDDFELGPHYEEYLSLHLDPAHYENDPGGQVARRTFCTIL